MKINHDTITLQKFFTCCSNAEEIKEKYNISTDDELRLFFKENFEDEYGYDHKFYIVEENGKLYTVDELIYPTIKKLNEKGYKTKFSCQGNKHGDNGYIAFDTSLSIKQRQMVQYFACILLTFGLKTSIDCGFFNLKKKPVIRFSICKCSSTYPDSWWMDTGGYKHNVLLNNIVYYATIFAFGNSSQMAEAIEKLKEFQEKE